jgi:hypothetical protein
MPSSATSSSTNGIPAASQAAISSALIGRDAPATSIDPSQNWANPSPVPGSSTVISAGDPTKLNSSAT